VSIVGVEHPLAPIGKLWQRVGAVHEREVRFKVIDLGSVRDLV
jgi:hypothetical protein